VPSVIHPTKSTWWIASSPRAVRIPHDYHHDFERGRRVDSAPNGARPMRRAVEKYLEDPLAEEFLRGNIEQGDTLEVHAAGEQLALQVTVAGAT
jgi:hypothetical protein